MKTNHPIGKVRQLQRKLYLSAKRSSNRRFHALYERIHSWEVLEESWKRVRANRGAAGIDEKTLEEIEAGLGFFDLTRPSLIQYPGRTYAKAS